MAYRKIALTSCVLLFGCGGGGGGGNTPTTPTPPADTTAPVVAFSPNQLSVESGMTGMSSLTATDAVGVTSGPTVSCTNGGAFDVATDTFTAATVTSDTESVCTATARDAAGNEGSGTLTVTMTAPTSRTVSGQVIKGPVVGAVTDVFDISAVEGDPPIATITTESDGRFSLTVEDDSGAGNFLVVLSRLSGAQMVCDAANCESEGGVPFGSLIDLPADPVFPGSGDQLLGAVVEMPAAGTMTANVNFLTHIQFLKMFGEALGRQQQGGTAELFAQDYAIAREQTARLFDIDDQDFWAIPAVDVTSSITSTDPDAIYVGLLSGGLLGAALEADDPFRSILDFQSRILFNILEARESTDVADIISLEDILDNALALADQIDLNTNAFTQARDKIVARQAAVAAAAADRFIGEDGELPTVFTDIGFASDSRSFSSAASSAVVSLTNPDNLIYTASLNAGEGSEFFDVAYDTPTLLNIIFNGGNGGVPGGTYTLSVTFDTAEGEPNTDSIEIVIAEPNLGVVPESVTIVKSQTDNVTFGLENPTDQPVTSLFLSGTGSEFFFPNLVDNLNMNIQLNTSNGPVPAGDYELTVDIETSVIVDGEPVRGTDTLNVFVRE